jgi:hypothetical protein
VVRLAKPPRLDVASVKETAIGYASETAALFDLFYIPTKFPLSTSALLKTKTLFFLPPAPESDSNIQR